MSRKGVLVELAEGSAIDLPTGAATETSLAAASAKLPASLGIKTAAGSLSITPASDSSFMVQGTAASGAAIVGNPVLVGGAGSGGIISNMRVIGGASGWVPVSLGAVVAGSDGLGTSVTRPITDDGNVAPLQTIGYLFNGTTMDRQRGDTNGGVVQSGLSSTFWNYAAAASGISNTTTAVTIKAAAGAGVRNYLKTLTLESDALGAATEIAIRDGAAGTVLWRGKIGTAGVINGRLVTFDPPLKGTANTLLEFVTLTASITGAVYVNATGFTGS